MRHHRPTAKPPTNRPRPSIREAFTALAAEAQRHAVGGRILRQDLPALYRATARDAGVTVEAVKAEMEGRA